MWWHFRMGVGTYGLPGYVAKLSNKRSLGMIEALTGTRRDFEPQVLASCSIAYECVYVYCVSLITSAYGSHDNSS